MTYPDLHLLMTPPWESDYRVWRLGSKCGNRENCRSLCQWTKWEVVVSLTKMAVLEMMRSNRSRGVCYSPTEPADTGGRKRVGPRMFKSLV